MLPMKILAKSIAVILRARKSKHYRRFACIIFLWYVFLLCIFPGNEETQSGAEGTGEGPQAADPPAPRTGGADERPGGAGDFRRIVVFAQYPRFAADYERLVSGGCLTETPDGLGWHKSSSRWPSISGIRNRRTKNAAGGTSKACSG
jgi:hypothetical protein